MIKKIPLPMAGLILGLFALGNLLRSYGDSVRWICGGIGAILYIMYVARLFVGRDKLGEEMKNPVVASVFATFPMSTMLFATYLMAYGSRVAYYLWMFGLFFHGLLIIWFTMSIAIKKDIKTVFPTWYIMYVGIVVATVTGKMFQATVIVERCFWFGLVCYIALIPIVCYRVFIVKNIPEPAMATFLVLTAPGGLLLTGYMSGFEEKQMIILVPLMIVSGLFFIVALTKLPQVLKLKFYPSISAITFPTVITAIGFKLANGFFVKAGTSVIGLGAVALLMEWVAVFCVFFCLALYVKFLVEPKKA
ncbi:MAG: TDT family transporter [Peptostreptococcaceae bacterium]|nr:TDT family transporter [Peptostreptococcaceae bacterium]